MRRVLLLSSALCLLTSCGGDDGRKEPVTDGGATMGTGEPCEDDSDCNDGALCNGVEECLRGFCEPGEAMTCDDGIDCTDDRCSHLQNGCVFEPRDDDGDGHADANCFGPDGESLGDDCDDGDATRFPGNIEVCTVEAPEHDEDCDPRTFGLLDEDADGFTDVVCCNAGDGETFCGVDCDDGNASRFPEHPEICDGIDNNCNGEVDTNVQEVNWYPDEDGDRFGDPDGDAVESCAPVENHALRPTDCDDKNSAAHPAAREICDEIDNDCDGEIDEGGVCSCSPEGNVRACACQNGGTGVQSCTAGTWDSCDCTECVDGVMDGVAGLIPRVCVNGLYQTGTACSGARPICASGECVCPDGTLDCVEVTDIVAPRVVAHTPVDGMQVSVGAQMAIVFNESVAPGTVSSATVELKDSYGDDVPFSLEVGGANVLITPDAPLNPGLSYSLSALPGIEDLSKNGLAMSWSVMFETLPAQIPLILPPPPSPPVGVQVAPDAQGGGVLLVKTVSTSPIPRTGLTAYSWLGTNWDTANPVEISAPQPLVYFFEEDVAVDSNGDAVVVWVTNNSSGIVGSHRRVRSGGSWAATEEFPTASGAPGAPRVVAGGSTVIQALFRNPADGAEVFFNARRDGTLGADSGAFLTSDQFEVSANASGDSGYFVNAFDLLQVGLHPAGGTWTSPVSLHFGMVSGLAFGIAPTGGALACWSQISTTTQIQCQDVLVDGTAPDAAFFLNGSGTGLTNEDLPSVGIDGSGNQHVVFVNDLSEVIAYTRTGGVIGAPTRLDPNQIGNVQSLRIWTSTSGRAVAVWLKENSPAAGSPRDLWGAIYSPGAGWQKAQRLEEDSQDVHGLDSTMDLSTGAVWIALQQGGAVRTTRL